MDLKQLTGNSVIFDSGHTREIKLDGWMTDYKYII